MTPVCILLPPHFGQDARRDGTSISLWRGSPPMTPCLPRDDAERFAHADTTADLLTSLAETYGEEILAGVASERIYRRGAWTTVQEAAVSSKLRAHPTR